MNDRPKIVCILGSSKFRDQMMGYARQETLKGHIVLSLGFYHHTDVTPITERQKQQLDVLMLKKIDMADECLVVCPNGYIGETTRKGIEHADAWRKPVRYTEPRSGGSSSPR